MHLSKLAIGMSSLFAVIALPASVLSSFYQVVDSSFGIAQNVVIHSGLNDNQLSTVSNVLKTKHDTVKNSINNVR